MPTPRFGTGAVLHVLDEDLAPLRAVRRPFANAAIAAASVELLDALQRSSKAGVVIGTWRSGQVETQARLKAQGFNRHTFLCGQSGSGKTYALGVILEQLLLETELRLVILDPNADFVRLGETLPQAPADSAQKICGARHPHPATRLRWRCALRTLCDHVSTKQSRRITDGSADRSW